MKSTCCAAAFGAASLAAAAAGNVIFIHPDGAGIPQWQAARMYWVGPDGDLNWDKLDRVAVYRGHMLDCLTASSNGGATTHAYGVKVPFRSFGTDPAGGRPKSAGGKRASLMHEAIERGLPVGIVNSGSIIEPGTAAFLASIEGRGENNESLVSQLIESGADVILSGGEEWFLPAGMTGFHGGPGKRRDGVNLIEKARSLGYAIAYTLDELKKLPAPTPKVLGIFATEDTFNDKSEEELAAAKQYLYKYDAPTIAEMTAEALRFLSSRRKDFLLVVEEEGADNFGNHNNAAGVLEALRRADEAFGVAIDFVRAHADTLVLTAADSEAGDMDVISLPVGDSDKTRKQMEQYRDRNGAPYDGERSGEWFLARPDRSGKRWPFLVTWGSLLDTSGGIVVRGTGRNSEKIAGSFDNTKIYSLMRETLFGE